MARQRENYKEKIVVRLSLAAIILIALVLPGCSWSGSARFRETRDLVLPQHDGAPLEVTTTNGSIEVLRDDGDEVRIQASLRATTEERLAMAAVTTEQTARGALRIGVDWPEPGRRSSEGCSFVIRMPSFHGVRLETSNGRITLRGSEGPAWLRSSNGTLVVSDHAGPIDAQTSNGSVRIEGVLDEARLRSSNGRIEVTGVSGHLDARTSNGSVSVRLADDFGGTLELDTSNGRIRTSVSQSLRDVRTSRTHAYLAFERPGPESVVSTSNGSITVK